MSPKHLKAVASDRLITSLINTSHYLRLTGHNHSHRHSHSHSHLKKIAALRLITVQFMIQILILILIHIIKPYHAADLTLQSYNQGYPLRLSGHPDNLWVAEYGSV